MNIKELEQQLLWKYPFARGYREFVASPLIDIEVTHTQSRIIENNGNILRCSLFYGMEGLYRKDQDDTFAYGRYMCDSIKEQFSCGGFFTSDELPRYGIKRTVKRQLYEAIGKKTNDGNLLFILAYDCALSERIYHVVTDHYTFLFPSVFRSPVPKGS